MTTTRTTRTTTTIEPPTHAMSPDETRALVRETTLADDSDTLGWFRRLGKYSD
jgi:hypothetical protein